MSLGFTRVQSALPGNTEADSKVARPRPEDWRVGERDLKMVAIVGKIGVPCGL